MNIEKNINKKHKEASHRFKFTQDIIPIKKVYFDGIFELNNGMYSKSYKFLDINYYILSEQDKENVFLKYSKLLNGLDQDSLIKITILNRKVNDEDFEKTMLMKMQNDEFDKYRLEYNQMLKAQAKKNNDIVQEKIITISTKQNSIENARNYFKRQTIDLELHLNELRLKMYRT